jgi:hypothetical protein
MNKPLSFFAFFLFALFSAHPRPVLSGTKYGVRQTRGKFGLGAKMALLWSKVTCR